MTGKHATLMGAGPEGGMSRSAAPGRSGLDAGTILPDLGRAGDGGFSLIELLIVMTIIGILVTAAVPQLFDATQRAEEATLRRDLFIMRDAIDQYYADRGEYPQRLNDLAIHAYLREIPEDPITDSRDTWVIRRVDWELLEEGERPGLWDVRSGAPGAGLNGVEYSKW